MTRLYFSIVASCLVAVVGCSTAPDIALSNDESATVFDDLFFLEEAVKDKLLPLLEGAYKQYDSQRLETWLELYRLALGAKSKGEGAQTWADSLAKEGIVSPQRRGTAYRKASVLLWTANEWSEDDLAWFSEIFVGSKNSDGMIAGADVIEFSQKVCKRLSVELRLTRAYIDKFFVGRFRRNRAEIQQQMEQLKVWQTNCKLFTRGFAESLVKTNRVWASDLRVREFTLPLTYVWGQPSVARRLRSVYFDTLPYSTEVENFRLTDLPVEPDLFQYYWIKWSELSERHFVPVVPSNEFPVVKQFIPAQDWELYREEVGKTFARAFVPFGANEGQVPRFAIDDSRTFVLTELEIGADDLSNEDILKGLGDYFDREFMIGSEDGRDVVVVGYTDGLSGAAHLEERYFHYHPPIKDDEGNVIGFSTGPSAGFAYNRHDKEFHLVGGTDLLSAYTSKDSHIGITTHLGTKIIELKWGGIQRFYSPIGYLDVKLPPLDAWSYSYGHLWHQGPVVKF